MKKGYCDYCGKTLNLEQANALVCFISETDRIRKIAIKDHHKMRDGEYQIIYDSFDKTWTFNYSPYLFKKDIIVISKNFVTLLETAVKRLKGLK